jgi:hypothetical protein
MDLDASSVQLQMFLRFKDNKEMTKNQVSSRSQTSYSSLNYQIVTPSI